MSNANTSTAGPACDRARINAYHDGELTAEQRRTVEVHLASCETCATELARLREIARLFAGHALSTDAMPPAALEQLHAAVGDAFEQHTRGTYEVLRLTRFVTGLAAAIMVAAGSWIVMKPTLMDTPVTPVIDSVAVVAPWDDPNLLLASTFDAGNGGAEARFGEWVVADLSRAAGK
jgi:anti-sigma factor RsiW